MKKLLLSVIAILILGTSIVFAAPYFRYERSLVPVDSTENLGTTTAPWAELHTNRICLTADCKTAWPSQGTGWASTTDGFSIYFTGRDFVGIGSSTPFYDLSVVGQFYFKGDDEINDPFKIEALNTNHALKLFKNQIGGIHMTFADSTSGLAQTDGLNIGLDSNGDAFIGNNENTGIRFLTSNSEKARFTAAGNLAIGTTTSTARLSIMGETYGSWFTSTSTNASTFPNASSTFATVSDKLWIGTDGKFLMGTTSCSSIMCVARPSGGGIPTALFSLADDVSNGFTIIQGINNNIQFNVDGSSNETELQPNSGKVGIGTTSPWATLAINPRTGGASNKFVIGSSTATNFVVNNAGFVGIGTSSPGTIFSIGNTADPELSINIDNVGTSTFGTGINVLQGCLAVKGICVNSSGNSKWATSTTDTDDIFNVGDRVGIGSTSPWGGLSIMKSTNPAFVIATSTGQPPLFFVIASTTLNQPGGRIGIGTTTLNGYTRDNLRDQLTVDGRINSSWKEMRCDYPGASITAALSGTTPNVCGFFTFLIDGAGLAVDPNTIYAEGGGSFSPSVFRLWAGGATNAAFGAGASIRAAVPFLTASSSPIFEVNMAVGTSTQASYWPMASSTLHLMGFATTSGLTANLDVIPFTAAMFTATSTTNWIAFTRVQGDYTSWQDTGVASTTEIIQKRDFRVEINPDEVLFLIDNNVVHRVVSDGTNIPVSQLNYQISIASTAAGKPKQMEIARIRLWSKW